MKRLAIFLFSLSLNLVYGAGEPVFPQLNHKTEKWHYLDASGEIVLKITLPNISNMMPFSEGMAAVQDSKTSLWGYINISGKWLIKPKYTDADSFKGGYALVSELCKINCNKNEDGILSDYVQHVIDMKDKIIITDRSQEEDIYTRYFFSGNLGHGLFKLSAGYGWGDIVSITNLKGDYLCDFDSNNGKGDVIYDEEMKAYRCSNVYYNLQHQLILDLSMYGRLQAFSEGYVWANLEEQVVAEEIIQEEDGETSEYADPEYLYWLFLLDSKGNVILKLDSDEYRLPTPIENGSFVYLNQKDEWMIYSLKTKQSSPYTLVKYDTPEKGYLGEKRADGSRIIYETDMLGTMIGYLSNKREFYPRYIF